jgi:hypothetical protein
MKCQSTAVGLFVLLSRGKKISLEKVKIFLGVLVVTYFTLLGGAWICREDNETPLFFLPNHDGELSESSFSRDNVIH